MQIIMHEKLNDEVLKIYEHAVNHRRFGQNYTIEKLQGGPWFTYNGICASSILKRDCCNIPRVLNRYFYHSKPNGLIPVNYNGRSRESTVIMLDMQVDWCYENGFRGAFFSREDNLKIVKRNMDYFNEVSKYRWTLMQEKQLVNYKDSPSNWQWVVYTGEKYAHCNT